MEEAHFDSEEETFISSMLVSKSFTLDNLVRFYSILLKHVRTNGIVETVDAFNNIPLHEKHGKYGTEFRDVYEYMTTLARNSSYSIVDMRKRPRLLVTPPPHYILSIQTVTYRRALLNQLREQVDTWEELSEFFHFFFLGLLEENTITGEYIIERIHGRQREREKAKAYIDLLTEYGLESYSILTMNGKNVHMFSNSQTNDILQNTIQELREQTGGRTRGRPPRNPRATRRRTHKKR